MVVKMGCQGQISFNLIRMAYLSVCLGGQKV